MRLRPTVEPIAPETADDEIAGALAEAEITPLLCALAHLTGDTALLRDDLKPPAIAIPVDVDDPATRARLAQGRALALDVLRRYRDEGCPPPRPLDDETLAALVDFLTGGADGHQRYLPLFREELDAPHADPRAPRWHKDDVAPDREFLVVIVGAGMSGIVAGHRLAQAGVPYVILEKNDDVGGTWLENTYPGCRVDVPNHLYSYSFAQTNDWPHHFSTQETLLEYFRRCADELGVRPHIRCRTEVLSADWDDATGRWTVRAKGPDGELELAADAVVSAVGQLNRPRFPDIEGMDAFAGPAFHSAQWDHASPVDGRRVAVIGTGASAVQIIPEIAERASRLAVFQRTPPWFVNTPAYHAEVEPGLQWLLRHVPTYSEWYRLHLFWQLADGMLPATVVDPEWPDQERSVSAVNEMVRLLLTQYLEEQFADRPDLAKQAVPQYPPIAKRVLRDNGVWAATLKRDDVELVTEPIARIVAQGVETADGALHEADVIVWGTGFQASRFLTPMTVSGRGGRDLHETWDGDARAYKGITVPHFPNLFLMYGPNTNIVISGSIIYFSECEAHYIVEHIRQVLERGVAALDVRPEAHDRYVRWIDEGNAERVWVAADVTSWYKNAKGRTAQNWPFTLVEYWEQTRSVDLADHEVVPLPGG